ncbi:MAG: UbiA family prenyltransferase [Thermoplasmatota archaeon]
MDAPWRLLRLLRPLNCLLAAAGVVAGILLTAPWDLVPVAARVGAPMAAFLVTGFGNVANDLRDVEVDRVAHPSRPLPSGDVSRRGATQLAAALLSMALAAALLAGVWTLAFAAATVALLGLYEIRLKRGGFLGNAAVAALTASTFLFGAVASRAAWPAWRLAAVAAAMAFSVNLAREVAKDVEDLDADRGARRTLPMLVGNRTAGLVASGAAIVGIVASFPFFVADRGVAPLCGAEPSLWLVAAADGVVLLGAASAPAKAAWAQRFLKAGMALALLGFLAWPLGSHCVA